MKIVNRDLISNTSIVNVNLRFKDLIYITVKSNELADKAIPWSFMHEYDRGELNHYTDSCQDWDAVSSCISTHPKEQGMLLGHNGGFSLIGNRDESSSSMSEEGLSPKDNMLFRAVCEVEGELYATAMGKQIFKRNLNEEWIDHSPDVEDDNAVTGFEAIAGYTSSDLCAVGWDGEIWHYNGSNWEQSSSPTNLLLTDICLDHQGGYYACGRGGILLRKKKDQEWESIAHKQQKISFSAICVHEGILYAATYSGIYALREDDNLEPINFQVENVTTTGGLCSRDGVLCSWGAQDILLLEHDEWKRLL